MRPRTGLRQKASGAKVQVCYEPVCPENLVYDAGQKLCVTSCGKKLKYRPGDETVCQDACSEGVLYMLEGWCRKYCPDGSLIISGNGSSISPESYSLRRQL